jgi:hypothetical protein
MRHDWDAFCEKSWNKSFMYKRDFFDYHKNKIEDCSFMYYENNHLIGFLPGSKNLHDFSSHRGLPLEV